MARGGKLITLQGLADEVISPNQTIAYRQALVDRYGIDEVNRFMRLYMVPGFQQLAAARSFLGAEICLARSIVGSRAARRRKR